MATDKAAIATGVEAGEGLRKRTVAGSQDVGAPAKVEIDNKKLVKKVIVPAPLHFAGGVWLLN
jgi:hypothetical protein